MKVNRKNTPKMVVRPHFVSDFERLEREAHNRQRFGYTVAIMAAWVLIVLVWKLAAR